MSELPCLIGRIGRIAIERGRAGCAGTLANINNLMGFLDAFKACLGCDSLIPKGKSASGARH
jgi:hypothetical protein